METLHIETHGARPTAQEGVFSVANINFSAWLLAKNQYEFLGAVTDGYNKYGKERIVFKFRFIDAFRLETSFANYISSEGYKVIENLKRLKTESKLIQDSI